MTENLVGKNLAAHFPHEDHLLPVGSGGPCILVVDDDPGLLRMLQVTLERQGFVVAVAPSGQAALQVAAAESVSLVLLDIMMPDMDGLEVCRILKGDPATRHIPVILLTARDSVEDKVHGLEIGADDFVTKPYSVEELVARIRVQLRVREMSRQLFRRNRELLELYKSITQVTASLDLSETLSTIVKSAVAATEAASSNIALFNEADQVSHLVAWGIAGDLGVRPEGLSRRVWKTGRALVLSDFAKERPGAVHPQLLSLGRQAAVCLPLQIRDRSLGVMWVHFNAPRDFSEEDLHLLSSFANQAAVAIENARLFAETRRLADTDELTGLCNHRYFYQLLHGEIRRAVRYARPLSLIMLDIDHFKAFNDRHGHLAGDDVLRELAQVLRKNSREVDSVARYGGEEFAVILPETDLSHAAIQAERIRSAVEGTIQVEGKEHPLTVSIGVASLVGEDERAEDLVRLADRALYRAKAAGRNRVCVASSSSV